MKRTVKSSKRREPSSIPVRRGFVFGCDPGRSGATVFLDVAGMKEPIIVRHDKSEAEIAEAIRKMRKRTHFGFMEKVHSGGFSGVRVGVKSMFTFGESFGLIRGMFVVCRVPFELVPPQRWQSQIGIRGKKKDKHANREKVNTLFPRSKVAIRDCDAILLAELARRHYLTTQVLT